LPVSRNWANYLLIAGGGVLIILELGLGAATGFDLALVGISLAAGGGLGLFFDSTKVGLFSAGGMALVYLAFFRQWIRTNLRTPNRPSNVDAIIGRSGIVTVRIGPDAAGQIKLGEEIWRAMLSSPSKQAREPGESVTVESIDGVTLIVR
jgi:membrane protein implicated in regulation of membrane protease activity